uniref:Secreted protein n=1 Tax=Steinernema glaseri TaxID=37863 RepID=A0A1I7YRE0_9BILA
MLLKFFNGLLTKPSAICKEVYHTFLFEHLSYAIKTVLCHDIKDGSAYRTLMQTKVRFSRGAVKSTFVLLLYSS